LRVRDVQTCRDAGSASPPPRGDRPRRARVRRCIRPSGGTGRVAPAEAVASHPHDAGVEYGCRGIGRDDLIRRSGASSLTAQAYEDNLSCGR
jgi:hypothetical protein